MSIEIPAGQVHPTVWTARHLRAASEDVRVRVIAAVLGLRCGAAVAPADIDDVCMDLADIVRGLGDDAAERLHPDDASVVHEASVAVGIARDLVAGLLRDLRAAGPDR